ncbi:DoxX family protein [Flavobacterium psychrophilum]|uniref:DoxX family protein n=1 Tax=Flavobacterium psychrophilum TaxID=96345 RepID=UPI00106C7BFE|nr:DoxX family protein [Flavobacterium psychrophilum]EKT4502420.1 DoxX family protein [Flavobacterium psychrophilum]
MNKHIISLTLRLVIGLNFLFVSIAHLKLWKFYVEEPTKITSWITNNSLLGSVIAFGLLIISIFLLVGYKTIWAALSAIALILINHIALLFAKPANDPFSGPFYNSFHHSVPFIGFAIVLLYALSTSKDFSIDRLLKQKENELTSKTKDEIVFLIARIFVGTIFFAQGFDLLTGKSTLMSFAENVYVKSYETTFIPKFSLWFMGLANPWILCIGGVLLTVGLKTKWTAYVLAFFMVSIAFGHLLGDPFETSGDISMFGFNNLAFVVLILWLENGQNKYSVDRLLRN